MTTLNESHSDTEKFMRDAETQHCLDSVDYLLKYKDSDHVAKVLNAIVDKCRKSGVSTPVSVNTPYMNTIPTGMEPEYPGDIEIEKKLEDIIRWNAMAMVIKANRTSDGIGGHISTFASLATLYEVGFNHFFKGNDGANKADQIFFQGHASTRQVLKTGNFRFKCC